MTDRRAFLQAAAATATGLPLVVRQAAAAVAPTIEVLNPRDRVPLSFVIDDSTCLVNMGHFCTPQFAAAFPKREIYQRPWQKWPREIPDAFVREFGEWCAEQGVKGKYSIVPNPACVGWLDRVLPGWSRKQLQDSLQLVRDLMVPNWDIHPEMITHTRVINLKTGRPFDEVSAATIENSYPQQKKSVDELAAYIAYALRILKNCDLPCEGVTTPGGFGNVMKPELSLAVQQAVRDVYRPEIVHYFKYVHGGDQSTQPVLEQVSGKGTDQLRFTVNVPAGTGDWFGSWQGVEQSRPDRYCNVDATSGRMVDLIRRGEPAVMLCHWPGMYCNGSKQGFRDFQRVVLSLAKRFGDQTIWMKMSEMARYWSAKELTEITLDREASDWRLTAPVAAPKFTVRIPLADAKAPVKGVALKAGRELKRLRQVSEPTALDSGTWIARDGGVVACFDLAKGVSTITLD